MNFSSFRNSFNTVFVYDDIKISDVLSQSYFEDSNTDSWNQKHLFHVYTCKLRLDDEFFIFTNTVDWNITASY